MTDSPTLPTGWTKAVGSDLFTFLRGVTFEKTDSSTTKGAGDVAILRAGNIQDGQLVLDDLVYVWRDKVKDDQIIRKDDLVVAMSSGSKAVVGKVATAKTDLPDVAFGAFCGLLRPNIGLAQWLSAFFQTRQYRSLVSSLSKGMNINNLKKDHLYSIEVPLPPLNEQHRIADKIDALQAKSRRAREALEATGPLLEKFRQSVLAAAFRGDLTAEWRKQHPDVEPAEKLLERIRAERRARWEEAELAKMQAKGIKPKDDKWKAKYTEPEPIDATGLPELPEGWCWSNVGTIADVAGGLTLNQAKRSKSSRIVPLVSVAAVQLRQVKMSEVKEIGLLDSDGEKGALRQGDILIVEGNGSLDHIGRVAIWDIHDTEARHQNHLIRVRPYMVSALYIQEWLASPRGRHHIIEQATSAAGLYNLSLSKVSRIPVPIAPQHEVDRVETLLADLLSEFDDLCRKVKIQETELARLDQSILAKAFRGELVPQDPNDEPASVLLERIKADREAGNGRDVTRRKGK